MTYADVADAVDRLLSPGQQEAFRACRAPGSMPVREFARVTDRSPGTVGNHLRRADDKLTEALGEFSLPLDFLTERDDYTSSWQRGAPLDGETVLDRLNRFGWRVELPDGDPHLCALGTERDAYVGWCDCKGFKFGDGPCAHLCTLRQAEFIDAHDIDDERVRIPDTEADADRAMTDGGMVVLDGHCPDCGGDAKVYPNPDHPSKGHIYCQNDVCGLIHRDRRAIQRYVDEIDDVLTPDGGEVVEHVAGSDGRVFGRPEGRL